MKTVHQQVKHFLYAVTIALIFNGSASAWQSSDFADDCLGLTCMEGDSASYDAVQAVCTKCHTSKVFLDQVRPWIRWTDVFRQMSKHGATGTDAQLDSVVTFFLENLTIINVNTSPFWELVPVLGISEDVGHAIVSMRLEKKFSGFEALSQVPGINLEALQRRKARIKF